MSPGKLQHWEVLLLNQERRKEMVSTNSEAVCWTQTHPSITAAVPFTRSWVKAPGPPHPLCPAARANRSSNPDWLQYHRQHSSKHACKPSGGGPEHTYCQVGRGQYGCPAGGIGTMERCARLLQTLLISSCTDLSSFY